MLWDGEVADHAELARLRHVTRVWMTQIMDLLNLSPDIQVQDRGVGSPLFHDPESRPRIRTL